jgi:hypothetical protein
MTGTQDPLGIQFLKDHEGHATVMRLSCLSLIRQTGSISVGIFPHLQNNL